ncbi:MAG: V-type ATP synthase subunit E family protein [Acidaminococcaceae bacterium]|jgi:V/A-type H+/Na+-transporting ATPase subunit E|nr:V-type ATP synthase subunit E family protein [Acidaminococcaceae bacterium]
MAANKIIEKIQQDAAAEVAVSLAQAKERASAAGEKIVNVAKAKVQEINIQAKADAEEASRRQMLIAELESRKKALDAKREVIEEAFVQAQKTLGQLPEDRWEKLITKIVVGASDTGTEELCVPSADRDKYVNGLLGRLNDALKAAGKNGQLTLSAQDAKFDGGIMLIGKNSDYDGSFATLIKEARVQIEKAVADMLFAAEVK